MMEKAGGRGRPPGRRAVRGLVWSQIRKQLLEPFSFSKLPNIPALKLCQKSASIRRVAPGTVQNRYELRLPLDVLGSPRAVALCLGELLENCCAMHPSTLAEKAGAGSPLTVSPRSPAARAYRKSATLCGSRTRRSQISNAGSQGAGGGGANGVARLDVGIEALPCYRGRVRRWVGGFAGRVPRRA